MTKKKKIIIIAGVLILGGLCIRGVYALYTGKAPVAENDFTVVYGDDNRIGEIEIIEEHWDLTDTDDDGTPDKSQELQPGETVLKDPYINAITTYDGFTVMKVSIPQVKATLDNHDDMYDVFNLMLDDTTYLLKNGEFNEDCNSDFILLHDQVKDGNHEYFFGYNQILEPNQTTSCLFNQIQVQDFTKIEEIHNGSINVSAAIVQSINPETGFEFLNVKDAFENGMDHDF